MISLYYKISHSLYLLYNSIKNQQYDESTIDKVIDSIKESGCLYIKLVQWILSRLYTVSINPNLKEKIEVFYDQCHEHSDEYTKQIFLKELGYELDSKYKIIKIVGSGSMGQVYQIQHLQSKTYYALKVLHPNIQAEFNVFYRIFQCISMICDIRKYIPVSDFKEFFDGLKIQMDLRNEANHILEFHQIHDDRLFLIPQVVQFSKNVLVMTYLESDSKKDISEYKQNMIFLKLILYNLIGIHHGLSHSDLHKGNWGIQKDKLIIYDFGYCVRYPYQDALVIEKLVLSSHDKYENLSQLVKLLCKYNEKETSILKLYKQQYDESITCDNLLDDILKQLIEFMKQYKIYLTTDCLNALITCSNLENAMPSQTVNLKNKHINKIVVGELIDICDSYQIFPDFSNYIKQTYIRFKETSVLCSNQYEHLKEFVFDK